MSTVYIVTKNLYLYSDIGIAGFFSTLRNSRRISAKELIESIPKTDTIRVYLNPEAAEAAVISKRKTTVVEDLNPLNAPTSRSLYTPVVLEVQLRADLLEGKDETSCIIDKELINLEKQAKVIVHEDGYNGHIPASISLTSINEQQCCLVM